MSILSEIINVLWRNNFL